MRSRSAPKMRVVPSAQAAAKASGGTRSGMSRAFSSMPRSRPGRTVTASPSVETSAPKRARIAAAARSPCRESGASPVTVTGEEIAPAVSQKAAFDQSPSTSAAPHEA